VDKTFPDRRGELFGRAEDIAYLMARGRQRGVTAVTGRAQMGKSWLLQEIGRQLSTAESGRILQEPPSLVGYTESVGQNQENLLLRTVVDLYTRWLTSESDYADQAKVVFEQNRKDFVGSVGETVGSLLKEVLKFGPKPLADVAGLVDEAFKGLANANRKLESSGVFLPVLQIDQAKELLSMVHKITKRRVVLILDQWEESQDLAAERSLLDTFARHLEDWPPCHIFVGTQKSEEVTKSLDKLEGAYPFAVKTYVLPLLRFASDGEANQFLGFIRERVPAAAEFDDARLSKMIAGYPGVVGRWSKGYEAREVNNGQDLERLTEAAHRNLYGEFGTLFAHLSGPQRLFCMRVALLPLLSDAELWRELKEIVVEGVKTADRDDLKENEVFVSVSPPSYGHAMRAQAALNWFVENRGEQLAEECQALVYQCGGRIRKIVQSEGPYIFCLETLAPLAAQLGLPVVALGVCQAALSTTDAKNIDIEKVRASAQLAKAVPTPWVVVVATCFTNTLAEAGQADNFELQNALLEDLRELYQSYAMNADVRRWLVNGLVITLSRINGKDKPERRELLLQEICELHRNYPEDAHLRESLAGGLHYLALVACEDGNLTQLDTLMEKFRELQHSYPDDSVVDRLLAKASFDLICRSQNDGMRNRRIALLEQLKQLQCSLPQYADLREILAEGLFNSVQYAIEEGEYEHRDTLLGELRQLQQGFVTDAAVRKDLAGALSNVVCQLEKGTGVADRDTLLDEFFELQQSYSDDALVRERYSLTLDRLLDNAIEENDWKSANDLAGALWQLMLDFPEDSTLTEMYRSFIERGIINPEEGE
jgi:hypothetical protein